MIANPSRGKVIGRQHSDEIFERTLSEKSHALYFYEDNWSDIKNGNQ